MNLTISKLNSTRTFKVMNYVQGYTNAVQPYSNSNQQGQLPYLSQLDRTKYDGFFIMKEVGNDVYTTASSPHYTLIIRSKRNASNMVFHNLSEYELRQLGYWKQNNQLDQFIPL